MVYIRIFKNGQHGGNFLVNLRILLDFDPFSFTKKGIKWPSLICSLFIFTLCSVWLKTHLVSFRMTESRSESQNVLGLLYFILPFLLQHSFRESFSQSSLSLRLDETMQCLLGNLQEAHPTVPGKCDGHFFPGNEQLQFQGNLDDRHGQGILEFN